MGKEPTLQEIPIDRVFPSQYQAREEFADEEQKKLIESLKAAGQTQPILVRPAAPPPDAPGGDSGPWYELISGERRWQAAKALGWSQMLAVIQEMTDEVAAVRSMVENELRQDLSAIERARGYQRMMNAFQWSQDQVAAKVGIGNRSVISNLLALLEEPAEIQELLRARRLTEGHCRFLRRIRDRKKRVALAKQVAESAISVKETEQRVQKLLTRHVAKKGKSKATLETEGPDYSGFRLSWKGSEIVISGRNFKPDKDLLQQFLQDLGGAIESFILYEKREGEPRAIAPPSSPKAGSIPRRSTIQRTARTTERGRSRGGTYRPSTNGRHAEKPSSGKRPRGRA